jgi:hypothetical protein
MADESSPAADLLEDVSFLVPFGYDGRDHLENIRGVVPWILRHFRSRVLVGGHELEKISLHHERLEYVKVDRHVDGIWRPGPVRNALADAARSPIVAIWDADVWCDPDQVREAAAMIRAGTADFAYPYDGSFLHIGKGHAPSLATDTLDVRAIQSPIRHPGDSVGGAVLYAGDFYRFGGCENDGFIDWGPDDRERHERFLALGARHFRAAGPLFHLDHEREHEHYLGNPYRRHNWKLATHDCGSPPEERCEVCRTRPS